MGKRRERTQGGRKREREEERAAGRGEDGGADKRILKTPTGN